MIKSENQKLQTQSKHFATESDQIRATFNEKLKLQEIQSRQANNEHKVLVEEAQKKLRQELVELQDQHSAEMREAQEQSEAHIAQVRQFFEKEKEKSDQRLLEEKERTSRRLHQMQ